MLQIDWNKVTIVSVAIAGVFGKCDSITQQDASHKNKIRR
jgi:hypothetical protein